MLTDAVMKVLRTGAQALGGYVFVYLASHGVSVPVEAQNWVVQTVIVACGVAAYTAAQHWLANRQGDGLTARGCRAAARFMMFGMTRQPVYVAGDERLRVLAADGSMRTPR